MSGTNTRNRCAKTDRSKVRRKVPLMFRLAAPGVKRASFDTMAWIVKRAFSLGLIRPRKQKHYRTSKRRPADPVESELDELAKAKVYTGPGFETLAPLP